MPPASQLARTPALFEPALGTVQLPFLVSEIDFFRPTAETWRNNWKAFHEWAHFYQFAATSYGALYRAATMAQLLTVARLLRLYERSATRCRLPLLNNETPSLLTLGRQRESASTIWQVEARLVRLLEDYRALIYGYKVAKPPSKDATDPERRLFLAVLQEESGMPPLSFLSPHEWSREEAELVNSFEVNEVLESHAHALSGLWLIQAVERFDLAPSVRAAALEETKRLAIGPYGRFFDPAGALDVRPGYLLHTICTLCDLALNPPGFSESPSAQTIVMFDTTWAPVSRLIHLLVLGREGRLPEMDMSAAGWQLRFLESFHGSLESGWDSYFLPYDRPPWNNAQKLARTIVEKVLRAIEQSFVPPAVGLYLEDWFQTYAAADRARSSSGEPLLLAGNSIEDLVRLVRAVGGPTIVVRRDNHQRTFCRWCIGLQDAGYARAGDADWNDQVVGGGIAWLIGLRALLYESRSHLASRLHEPLLGEGDLTLADLLGWYGRRLEDFDG
jgi:hypothetical protein